MHKFIKLVYTVSRITGEGGAEFARAWGAWVRTRRSGGEGGIYTQYIYSSSYGLREVRASPVSLS